MAQCCQQIKQAFYKQKGYMTRHILDLCTENCKIDERNIWINEDIFCVQLKYLILKY